MEIPEEVRSEYDRQNKNFDNQILMLVNASAQEFKSEAESLRLLQEAKKLAQYRNTRNNKGFKIMVDEFTQ